MNLDINSAYDIGRLDIINRKQSLQSTFYEMYTLTYTL